MDTPPITPETIIVAQLVRRHSIYLEGVTVHEAIRAELYHYAETGECDDPQHMVRRYIAATTTRYDKAKSLENTSTKLEDSWATRARRICGQLETEAGQDDAEPQDPQPTTTDQGGA